MPLTKKNLDNLDNFFKLSSFNNVLESAQFFKFTPNNTFGLDKQIEVTLSYDATRLINFINNIDDKNFRLLSENMGQENDKTNMMGDIGHLNKSHAFFNISSVANELYNHLEGSIDTFVDRMCIKTENSDSNLQDDLQFLNEISLKVVESIGDKAIIHAESEQLLSDKFKDQMEQKNNLLNNAINKNEPSEIHYTNDQAKDVDSTLNPSL